MLILTVLTVVMVLRLVVVYVVGVGVQVERDVVKRANVQELECQKISNFGLACFCRSWRRIVPQGQTGIGKLVHTVALELEFELQGILRRFSGRYWRKVDLVRAFREQRDDRLLSLQSVTRNTAFEAARLVPPLSAR